MATEEKKTTTPKKTVKKKQPAAKKTTTYKVKTQLDPHMLVPVRNGFAGTLYYRSRKTGEEFTWERFGDEQDMELAELKVARNSARAFFERNYFLIDDPEILEYLNAKQYYKDAFTVEDFEDVFTKDPDEVVELVSNLSKGQKNTLRYMSKQKIADGEIDSLKVIEALEQSLGVELIER